MNVVLDVTAGTQGLLDRRLGRLAAAVQRSALEGRQQA